jgi:LuxR family maltose regulon positive regulatory protein
VLLATKLHQPRPRAESVGRRHLLEALRKQPAALTLVVAPPGFGKTTTVTQWQEVDDRPFIWVSLDRGDNDPVVFWNYIIEAIGSIAPHIRGPMHSALKAASSDLPGVVVPRLLNELESLEEDAVLVLDDYHWIKNPACHDSLALFLERHPKTIQLVICTRLDPPFQLGRLRASGELIELRAADLSFLQDEAAQLLNDTFGMGLGSQAVSALWHRTEGWPAGIYLAYLSMRDAPDRNAFVEGFSGSNRHVVDYLSEVVLGALDECERSFLLEVSILDRMCGPLCDAVTGRPNSAETLKEFEQANLFLVPLDDRREWYRLHHLFAELLRDQFTHDAPDRASDLHRKAAEWFAAADSPDEAIRHAIAGGDLEEATRLIGEQYIWALEGGRIETILRWLEDLPSPAVAEDARLCVVKAWVMSFLNRREEATLALADALQAGYQGPLPDGASSLEASASLIRAGFPWDDVGEMLMAARRAFELEGNRESVWRVTAHAQLGCALYMCGQYDEARPLLERAAELAPLTDQWMNAFGASAFLARLDLVAGDPDGAERWANKAVGFVESHDMSDSPQTSFANVTMGLVRARKGDLEEGDRLMTLGLEQQRRVGRPIYLADAMLGLAPIRRALGKPQEALALLDEAKALIESCRDPGVLRDELEGVSRLLKRQVDVRSPLSDREIDVLRLLARGLRNREIAAALYVSYNTVHSHIRSIYRKLGAASRSDAISRARSKGLL